MAFDFTRPLLSVMLLALAFKLPMAKLLPIAPFNTTDPLAPEAFKVRPAVDDAESLLRSALLVMVALAPLAHSTELPLSTTLPA